MPELPEVETMRRGLLPIVGRRIESVSTPPCTCRPISIKPKVAEISKLLAGQRVESIGRLGKRVLIETADWALILQPKMTGLTTLTEAPDPGHVRLHIAMKGKPKMLVQFWDQRGLGTVELLAREQVEHRIVEGRLGPDALIITVQDFHERLTATARPVKVALLDQKILAGVGNLYASEMLHVARINPTTAARGLTRKQTKLLHEAMLDILNKAILHEGSTLSDGTYRNSLNDSGSYQNEHRVYDREGEACPSCRNGTIQRIVQAQRSTFYCPRCQKPATSSLKR
jgi:formamidopyrimidine-DNA glycosylase